ncbi:MAG: type II toxin-antitoxin system HipA family toxin, partial [Burkholderiales bacterium]|nr:type II toxin-antitoxin system HipA family toxin [Burkholderiales bacterium]
MATREVWEVWLDAAELEPTCLVGRLYQNLVKTVVPASFAYESAWLQGDTKFMLDPRLEIYAGEQNPQVDFPAFGIFMDSAPDRWGRVLMERRELLRAEQER